MHIERTHHLGKADAIGRIDTFLDDLLRRDLPGGAKIKEASKNWIGDTMKFSFKARKGLLGATISGVIHVSDQTIVMDSELPGLVMRIVGEDKIREVINRQLDELFPESP